MRFNLQWLQERVSSPIDLQQLLKQLTMAGLEVDCHEPVAKPFSNIVVAEVLSIEPHPDAKKLVVTKANAGETTPLQVVCGASNLFQGAKVPLAKVGANLDNSLDIKHASLRGVDSSGMLCSAKELGLADSSDGIFILPTDAPVGQDIREYLKLDDTAIELDITPNRGDCLGLEGIARETATLMASNYQPLQVEPKTPQIDDVLMVNVEAPDDCPRYVGRIIRDVSLSQPTPLWMQERLRRCGLRSIDPIVDVTNYVLLELGQPLHAFDLDKLAKEIVVRKAKKGEVLRLLDEQTIELDEESLVIADQKGPLALAGIMGGAESGVNSETQHIFIESAFFAPQHIAGRARRYGLHTDSSYRFERGVDFQLQRKAIERATELLLSIVGGKAGPVVEVASQDYLPEEKIITLRQQQIPRILGMNIESQQVENILESLGMGIMPIESGWQVTIPSYRFDISIEVDLIEEIARVVGYDNIPTHAARIHATMQALPEAMVTKQQLREVLIERGYFEAINYSFIDPKLQQLLAPGKETISLLNPISADLSCMRLDLWAGLLKNLQHNINRQQSRLQLFEMGLSFVPTKDNLIQQPKLAGLCWGQAHPIHWQDKPSQVDFFHCKGDLEALLSLAGADVAFHGIDEFPLHPGQCAAILRDGQRVGTLGALHPKVAQELDINGTVYLFELDLNSIIPAKLPKFAKLSKYPSIRRDIAVWVAQELPASSVSDIIAEVASEWLVDVQLFDVYNPEGTDKRKSLAFGFTLQHQARTLIDSEINELCDKLEKVLEERLGAEVRK